MEVRSFGDVQRQLDVGGRNRSTAATNMNEHSSRSHAIVALRVVQVRVAILLKPSFPLFSFHSLLNPWSLNELDCG